MYLGLNGIFDTIHDKNTNIVAYYTLSKKHYEQYKLVEK